MRMPSVTSPPKPAPGKGAPRLGPGRRVWRRAWIVCQLVLLLAARGTAAEAGPADEDIAWGTFDQHQIFLGLSVDRTRLRVGEELGVDVVIENRGKQARVIPAFGADNVVVFVDQVAVRAGDDEKFAREPLAPGKRKHFGVVLPMTEPGIVTIRAALRAVVADQEIAWLRAAPVEVTVTGKAKPPPPPAEAPEAPRP